jgi:glycosyltransferase involved in cell wall biosynthesis
MKGNSPRVSIGVPVYNGENYLQEALDSLLNQTYEDFEIILSDNASTDKTREIAESFAARDPRIRYFRNEENLGAARNYNLVFELARGDYFKWAAHDDLCGPELLEQCVSVLDGDPSIVLCYPKTKEINDYGEVTKKFPDEPDISMSSASKRYYQCVCVAHPQVAVFGLIRRSALEQTRLIGYYSSSDRVLLGELALIGKFHEVPEYMFFMRNHAQAHWRALPKRQQRIAWFDPRRAGKITFPHWRLLFEHYVSIFKSPQSAKEKLLCSVYMGMWIVRYWRRLRNNLFQRD